MSDTRVPNAQSPFPSRTWALWISGLLTSLGQHSPGWTGQRASGTSTDTQTALGLSEQYKLTRSQRRVPGKALLGLVLRHKGQTQRKESSGCLPQKRSLRELWRDVGKKRWCTGRNWFFFPTHAHLNKGHASSCCPRLISILHLRPWA